MDSIGSNQFFRLVAKVPTAILVVVLMALVFGHSSRTFSRVTTPGVFDNFERGFVDFHNAIHFPTKSFLGGNNPYSREYVENHPDKRTFPLFPPHSLIIHAPFGVGSIENSRVIYWLFELATATCLLMLIEWIILRQVTLRGFLYLGIALMVSIPLYTSFYMGQLTLQLVLGTALALHYSKTKPWLAIIGLTLAACKPQFGIPLAILLLCRRDWKTAIGGGLLSAALSVLAIAIIASNFGLGNFVEEIQSVYLGFDSHPDVGTAIDNGWRLDIYPVVARFLTTEGEMPVWSKFLIPVMYLAIGGLGVFLLRNDRDADPVSNMIICLTCLGCIYHSVYDGVLLLWPAAAIYCSRAEIWTRINLNVRWLMLLILVFLMVNVFHLEGVQTKLGIFDPNLTSWRIVASFGAIGIAVLMLVSVGLATKLSLQTSKQGVDSA